MHVIKWCVEHRRVDVYQKIIYIIFLDPHVYVLDATFSHSHQDMTFHQILSKLNLCDDNFFGNLLDHKKINLHNVE